MSFTEVLKAEQLRILQSGTPREAIDFARLNSGFADIEALQQKMYGPELVSAMSAYYFAMEVEGADIDALLQHAIDINDRHVSLMFALHVPKVNSEKVQQAIIANGWHYEATVFAEEVPTARRVELQAVVENSRDALSIFRFANCIKNADKASLTAALSQARPESVARARDMLAPTPDDLSKFDAMRVRSLLPSEAEGLATITYVEDTKEAYDACNTGELPAGSIFVVPSERVVGISWSWPLAVTVEAGELHTVEPGFEREILDDAGISVGTVKLALVLAQDYGYESEVWANNVANGLLSEPVKKVAMRMG